ncbi:hypothetical protein EA472_04240 [Natrarchaeobius oligotrophus]|uniref:Uncharacterized protein n=1 Tax=Natrarchaeobius chitinivorans TaxID=1679083 RepID=A0A3N6MHC7_NATCH|nr:hypothetical protein EA472_04240 [Natrarchaeobius chitinivorans]
MRSVHATTETTFVTLTPETLSPFTDLYELPIPQASHPTRISSSRPTSSSAACASVEPPTGTGNVVASACGRHRLESGQAVNTGRSADRTTRSATLPIFPGRR